MMFKNTLLYKSLAVFASSALIFGSSSLLAQEEIESTDVEAEVADVVGSADANIDAPHGVRVGGTAREGAGARAAKGTRGGEGGRVAAR